jgi:tripartite-type tricarboxylate transporter receptor subunit TctC
VTPKRKFLFAALAASALALPGAALAQAWPSKPIKVLVPFAAGGVTDVVVRTVAVRLGESLGQPIVVENKGGAGGTIGTAQGAQAAPDGYTFIAPAASHTTTPGLYSKLPFDPVKDFVAVTQIVTVPYLLVTNPSLPANNVREFVRLAKSKPNALVYGSAGNGSSNHLAGELFEIMAGVELLHSPYKGSGPALQDLMGGHIAFMFDPINTSSQHVRTGKLKALGVGTLKRVKALPDVPTIHEQGLEGFEAVTWIGLLAPAGTPREIVDRMQREIAKVLQIPEVQERLASAGAEPVGSTPEEFDAYMKSELRKWGDVIRKAKVPPVQ